MPLQDDELAGDRAVPRLDQQARLPDARLPGQQDTASRTSTRPIKGLLEKYEFPGSSDQDRRYK